jgi:hypothetical protein
VRMRSQGLGEVGGCVGVDRRLLGWGREGGQRTGLWLHRGHIVEQLS